MTLVCILILVDNMAWQRSVEGCCHTACRPLGRALVAASSQEATRSVSVCFMLAIPAFSTLRPFFRMHGSHSDGKSSSMRAGASFKELGLRSEANVLVRSGVKCQLSGAYDLWGQVP